MINPATGLALHFDGPPLRVDEGGAVRVGNSRISLDLIVEQYENGMTPEDMVRAYDSLALADVYAAISYYLRYRDEVDVYLKRREAEAQTLRAKSRPSSRASRVMSYCPTEFQGEGECSGWRVTLTFAARSSAARAAHRHISE